LLAEKQAGKHRCIRSAFKSHRRLQVNPQPPLKTKVNQSLIDLSAFYLA
jgi:hypothetical protein